MFKRTCVVVALALSAFVFAASRAGAGSSYAPPVQVDWVSRQASGTLYLARNSADSMSWIGCRVEAWRGGSSMTCDAHSPLEKDKQVTCTSTDPDLIQNAGTIGPYDLVTFQWDGTGQCTRLEVSHHSATAPVR